MRKKRPASGESGTRPASPAATPAANPSGIMLILDDLLGSKAPIQIPGKLKYLIAKFGHWLMIVLMLLVLPGQLIGLGMRAALLPFAGLAGSDSGLELAFALATLLFLIVILVMALPGLYSRKAIGWQLLMLANIINMIYGLISGGIIGPFLGTIINLFVLMQMRRYYM